MTSHYGVQLIPHAHKNAINVIIALLQNEDPSLSENIGQAANADGSELSPVEWWFGGRTFSFEELQVFQSLPNNLPAANWPVQGVGGPVSLADAEAAASAFEIDVSTKEGEFEPQQAYQTLTAALASREVQKIVYQ